MSAARDMATARFSGEARRMVLYGLSLLDAYADVIDDPVSLMADAAFGGESPPDESLARALGAIPREYLAAIAALLVRVA